MVARSRLVCYINKPSLNLSFQISLEQGTIWLVQFMMSIKIKLVEIGS